jgi:hypothetical protein
MGRLAAIVQSIGPLKTLVGSGASAQSRQRFLIVTEMKDPTQVVLRQGQ